ncbi:hypothetical protein NFI96_003411 [Prochilodus magdalenae]|nr:hypothetical protein NFI96_003411 [Prochilodus magdalenae]
MMHKKARKQFAEDRQTKDTDYWNHGLWSVKSNLPNLFGSDGVKRMWWQPVFQHDNDPKHTSKATTALLRKLRVKVLKLNPIEHLWGILKRKVEECKVSNIHQLRDVIMEEYKRIPVAICEALVNSSPKRVKVPALAPVRAVSELVYFAIFGDLTSSGDLS